MTAVEVAFLARKLPLAPERIETLVRSAISTAARVAGRRVPRVSVTIVGDRRMRRLNREFHDSDRTTDVLAFDLDGRGEGPDAGWEIVVCAAKARREARYRRLDETVELLLYVVHGTLHLLGEEDRTPSGRRRMRELEAAILRELGMELPEDHVLEDARP